MTAIEVKSVTKRFKDKTIINNISISLEAGKIHGLIGRNGSGKTVLMKMIIGFLKPDSGEIRVFGDLIGKDVDFAKNVGAIIETPGFLPFETGFSNLKYLASIRGKISDIEIRQAISSVGLDPNDKKHVGKYSLGMRQRLGLAQAIMENPDLLILDEPMNGLDKDGVLEMRQYLLGLKEQVDDDPVPVTDNPSEEVPDVAEKVNPLPKKIPPQNDEPQHKFRR